MNGDNFSRACTEMIEILKLVPDEEFNKIENDFIEMLYQEKNLDYKFEIDESKELLNQELLPETYDMLTYIYGKYLCNADEKKEFKEKMLKKETRSEESTFEQKNFENKTNKIALKENENIIKRFLNWIKKFLNKK